MVLPGTLNIMNAINETPQQGCKLHRDKVVTANNYCEVTAEHVNVLHMIYIQQLLCDLLYVLKLTLSLLCLGPQNIIKPIHTNGTKCATCKA